MYINTTTNEYPYSLTKLRQENKSTVSFPAGDIPADTLEEFGIYPVVAAEKPAGDIVTESFPALINGVWTQTWVARAFSPEEVLDRVPAMAQKYLDDFARSRNYDGILSACTYATSAFPRFASDGQYCVAARDAVWGTLCQMLGDVQAGHRPVPTIAEALAELPILVWPA